MASLPISFSFGPNDSYVLRAGEWTAISDQPCAPPPDVDQILMDEHYRDVAQIVLDVGLPMEPGTYMLRWRTEKGGRELHQASCMGPHYARLYDFIVSVDGATTQTTFGPDHSYFSTSQRGCSWQNLPQPLENFIVNNMKAKTPTSVALGVDGTYCVIYSDGSTAWELSGRSARESAYPQFEELITRKGPRNESEASKRGGLKYVALSPFYAGPYFAVFNDNSMLMRLPGSWKADVSGIFKEWATSLARQVSPEGRRRHTREQQKHNQERIKQGAEVVNKLVDFVHKFKGED